MHSHLIAILLATVAIGSCIANPSLISGPSRMMQIMSATSEMQRANPQQTSGCFNYYNAILESDWAAYQEEYKQCDVKYDDSYGATLKQYDSIVSELDNSTQASCNDLIKCNWGGNSLHSLACYSTKGSRTTKNLTEVTSSAVDFYASLSQEIKQLDYTCELCYNASARNYEIRSGNTYTEFQACLLGLSPVPEITTTTTTTGSPITSTPQPESSSTESSTSAAPISSSSAAPATTSKPKEASHNESDENSSAISRQRLASRLESIFKRYV
ncbi:uncharacterized protein [Drosophila takahashii]|uniref:uncharacterized protein n=1 Tax=Drosophila takahashii TaxID=29030 RepID=UPI001CF89340|nr:uncharacterized protein LOC108066206 [Drosophila takahashii]